MAYAAIERSDAASPPSLPAPGDINEWQAQPGGLTEWRPIFQNPSAEVHQTFRRPSDAVGLYIAYYRNQDKARKLVSSDNTLVRSNDPAWARVASGMQTVQIGGDQASVRTAELRAPGGDRLMAWQFYWIDGRFTASDHLAKGFTALSRLMGRGDDSAVIIVYARKDQSGEASVVVDAFLQNAGTVIATALSSARETR
jgi:EpsI family protein